MFSSIPAGLAGCWLAGYLVHLAGQALLQRLHLHVRGTPGVLQPAGRHKQTDIKSTSFASRADP